MNFQYYNTLKNKDLKSIFFYISEIRPEFNEKEIQVILSDFKAFIQNIKVQKISLKSFKEIDIGKGVFGYRRIDLFQLLLKKLLMGQTQFFTFHVLSRISHGFGKSRLSC